ncbi:MAG: hypothetical protein ABEJ26_00700, partial [Halosimplex sp.]
VGDLELADGEGGADAADRSRSAATDPDGPTATEPRGPIDRGTNAADDRSGDGDRPSDERRPERGRPATDGAGESGVNR